MHLYSITLRHNITAIFTSIYSCTSSPYCKFTACPLTHLSSPSEPISILSICNRGFRFISHALEPTVEDNVNNHDEELGECSDFSDELKQKIEEHGIKYSSCTPGQFHLLICPKCNGGQSTERSLSFYIAHNKNLSLWRCFADECGWAGKVLDSRAVTNGGNHLGKNNSFREMTEKGLKLEPLDDELIAYFSERMISRETLEKNNVMQISGTKEKGAEQIFYGLDDIRDADEIVVVRWTSYLWKKLAFLIVWLFLEVHLRKFPRSYHQWKRTLDFSMYGTAKNTLTRLPV